jgi:hypothetical protein
MEGDDDYVDGSDLSSDELYFLEPHQSEKRYKLKSSHGGRFKKPPNSRY